MTEAAPAVGVSVGAALADAAETLSDASDTARLDAELLLGAALDPTRPVARARLVLDRDRPVPADARLRFEALVARRTAGEPVAYLLGRQAFRWLDVAVDPRVLIPRPETELLVEAGLSLPQGASVLDVGTGSGAVALALAHERPDLRVSGVDCSADAVAVARGNAERLGLDVSFRVADLLNGAPPVDAVLANLPYIADADPLPVDVADFEPARALYGGPDGLDVIRRLSALVADASWPALLALEIGAAQGPAVAQLVRGAGFGAVTVRPDLAGRDRVVVGRR